MRKRVPQIGGAVRGSDKTILKAGVCNFVEENEIPAKLLDRTESQQARQARGLVTKKQWLERKAAEWNRKEKRRLRKR